MPEPSAGPPGDGVWAALRPDAMPALLDGLTDGLLVLDQEWRCAYLNEPAAQMLGRARDELLGRHVWTAFPEAVGGPSSLAYQRARATGERVTTTEFYAPLGRLFEVRAHPVDEQVVVLFRDITDFQQAMDELQEYAGRMAEAERIARFGAWKWDLTDGRLRWSDELQRLYGLEPGTFGGTVEEFVDRLHPDDRDRVRAEILRAVEAVEPFTFQERIVRPDGTERILLARGRVVTDDEGSAVAVVGICSDVTDRVLAERALGLSENRLRELIAHSPNVIAVKDLEGRYTMANPANGRLLGMDPEEMVGRFCADLYEPEVAQQLRENDRTAVAEQRTVVDEVVMVRGDEPRTYDLVTFPLPDDRGQPVEVCTIGMDVTERRAREGERRERAQQLRRITTAIEDDRLELHAQPILDLASGERPTCELLVRLRDEDDPTVLVPPAGFLPGLERHGLVPLLDRWVVGQALARSADRRLEVNLSAVTLRDTAAADEIVDLLSRHPAAARNLTFEITETADPEHFDGAERFGRRTAALGCGLSLDDFGTGFGAFTYLRTLPLRSLKIDRSFVARMTRSEPDRHVVQSIIGIAGQFGLQTIAEGVEDAETLALLHELGADHAQGFHIGRPVPVG